MPRNNYYDRIEAGVEPEIKKWLMQPHINTSGAVRAALREYIPDEELAELSDENGNDGEATPSNQSN